MFRILTILYFVLFLYKYSFSQNEKYKLADKYYNKSVEFESVQIDSSFYYAKKAYQILNKLDTVSEKYADILNQYGRVHFHKKEYHKAYSIFSRSFAIQQTLGNEANSYKLKVNMAVCQKELENYKVAIQEFIEVAKYYEKNNPTDMSLGITYFGIADLYFLNKQFETADNYYTKTIPFFKNNRIFMAQLNSNRIANFNSFDLDRSLKLIEEMENTIDFDSIPIQFRGALFNGIGQSLVKVEKYDKALDYTMKSLTSKKLAGYTTGLAIQYNNIADIYIKKERYKEAIIYLDSALENANNNIQKFQILKNLTLAHKNNENFKKSLEYANRYIALKDSANEAVTKKEIAELGLKYNEEKKDKLIDVLINLSTFYKISILVIIIICISVLVYFYIKDKKTFNSLKNNRNN